VKVGTAETERGQAGAQPSRSNRLRRYSSRVTRHASRQFIIAWHFLTAIPISRRHHEPAAAELAASMAWYSTIGLLIGGILASADFALAPLFKSEIVNALLIILLVLLTRGMHQDGLADMLDGLAGGRTPAERLTIMRDPRIGAVGATGLFLSLLLRYAGLLALPPAVRLPALICMPAVGRWTMVTVAWMSHYARTEGGLGAPFLIHLSFFPVLAATVVVSAALVMGVGPRGAIAAMGLGMLVVAVAWAACRKWFGGVTGDTLGATNEIAEILFLLLLPLILGLR
jgi:adenosylcobinamide-GDP ribazoletransferase